MLLIPIFQILSLYFNSLTFSEIGGKKKDESFQMFERIWQCLYLKHSATKFYAHQPFIFLRQTA